MKSIILLLTTITIIFGDQYIGNIVNVHKEATDMVRITIKIMGKNDYVKVDLPQAENRDLHKGDWVTVQKDFSGNLIVKREASRYAAMNSIGKKENFSLNNNKYPYLMTIPKGTSDHPDPLRFKKDVFWYDKNLPGYRYKDGNGIPAGSPMCYKTIYSFTTEERSESEYFDAATMTFRSKEDNSLMCEDPNPNVRYKDRVKCKDIPRELRRGPSCTAAQTLIDRGEL